MFSSDSTGIGADSARFIGAGIANTLLTIALYQIFLLFLPHDYAYTLSWLSGFVFLMVIYPSKVFAGKKYSIMRKFSIAVSYLSIFFIGLIFLDYLVQNGLHERTAIFVIVFVSALLNFFLSRFLLRGYFLDP